MDTKEVIECNICGEDNEGEIYWTIKVEIIDMQSFKMTVCQDCFIRKEIEGKVDGFIRKIERIRSNRYGQGYSQISKIKKMGSGSTKTFEGAIEFLTDHYPIETGIYSFREKLKNKLNIITLLKRGKKLKVENKELKKYKLIWEDFNHYPHLTVRNIQELISELKQKYFPKKEKNGKDRNKIKKNTP